MGDLVALLVVLAVTAVPAIIQALAKQAKANEAKAQAARGMEAGRPAPGVQPGQPAAANRPAGRPAPGVQPGQPAAVNRPAKLEDEIGDFLRRAAQGRQGQARGAQAGRPAQPRPAQPRPAQGRPVQAEVVQPARRPVGGKVEAIVAKELDTSRFKQRASQLGQRTRETSKNLEARVHEKFDHELSKLAGQIANQTQSKTAQQQPVPVVGAIPATGAAGFAAMLHDLQNVRQAIVLNEILARPTDRW